MFDKLAKEQAVREEDVVQRATRVSIRSKRPRTRRWPSSNSPVSSTNPQIDGVNTSVANVEAQLRQAQYYLDNTTLVAPEDGRIINLQVRPGMVSGIYRIGGIAALIAEADRYVLATFFQENLKYVRPGQPVEIALDLYPGQIFAGKVDSIWRGNGVGQYLPTDEIPKFHPPPPNVPQGQYAVKILLDGREPTGIPDRRARDCGHLHERRTRRLGSVAQDFHPHPLVAELALSDQFLRHDQEISSRS